MSVTTKSDYAQVVTAKQKCRECQGHGYTTTTKTIRSTSRKMTLADAIQLSTMSVVNSNANNNQNSKNTTITFQLGNENKNEKGSFKIPYSTINFLDVQGTCYETYPCQHDVRLIFKIGNEFVYYTTTLDATEIGNIIACLSPSKTHKWVLEHVGSQTIQSCDVTNDCDLSDADGDEDEDGDE